MRSTDSPAWLADYPGALDALRTLTKQGCRRELLVPLLEGIRALDSVDSGPRSVRSKTNLDQVFKGELAKARKTLMSFARAVGAVRSWPAAFLLPPPEPLLQQLVEWGVALAKLQRVGKNRTLRNVLLALLVYEVTKQTGSPHDTKVSKLLLAASVEGEDFSAGRIKTWRRTHKGAIEAAKKAYLDRAFHSFMTPSSPQSNRFEGPSSLGVKSP